MARSITDTLRDLRRGTFADEATQKLAALVSAVSDTGKPGTLTIELKLKAASRAAGALIITDRITVKMPVDTPDETMMFGTVEGSLVTDDPKQKKLDLRVAEAPDNSTLKTAAAAE